MNKDEILLDYDDNIKLYEEFKDCMVEWISKIVDMKKVTIKSRIKDKDKLSEKIDRKWYSNIWDITDIIWLRVIVFLKEEIDEIHNLINDHYNISFYDSVDKRKWGPTEFWYKSLHLIIKWEWRFNGLYVEIQIRTILQDAWAEIEHWIWYKSSFWIPYNTRRNFSRISGMLELCDIEFSNINNEKKGYEINISSEINFLKDEDFNEKNLKKYIEESKILKFIDIEIANYYWNDKIWNDFVNLNDELHRLKYFKIDNFQSLTKLLVDNKELIIDISRNFINIPKWNTKKWITIFYLWYTLLKVNNSDLEIIKAYIEWFTNISNTEIVINKLNKFSILS